MAMTHQPESTLLELIRYNQWATQQLLMICMGLDESQLTTPIPGAYGTVRRTFDHLLQAEADYIGRITGTRPAPPFRWEDGTSLEQLHAFAGQLGQAFRDVIERVPPTQNVHEEENGLTMDYHARHLFMQVITHGIEHRVNITTHLNALGVALPELDSWGYLFAHAERFDLREGSNG
jgi:uncharacterized damage-inducible protein DinB